MLRVEQLGARMVDSSAAEETVAGAVEEEAMAGPAPTRGGRMVGEQMGTARQPAPRGARAAAAGMKEGWAVVGLVEAGAELREAGTRAVATGEAVREAVREGGERGSREESPAVVPGMEVVVAAAMAAVVAAVVAALAATTVAGILVVVGEALGGVLLVAMKEGAGVG